MLNDRLRRKLKAKSPRGMVYPRYDGYSLPNIPNTVVNLFGIKKENALNKKLHKRLTQGRRPKKIILILIDGFGYMQWLKYYKKMEFFRNFTKKGIVSPITTVFPSTTANAVTAVATGQTTIQHELIEWTMYLNKIDAVIETLPLRRLGETGRNTLLKEGVTSKDLFHGIPIDKTLKTNGVKSYMFVPNDIMESEQQAKARKYVETVGYNSLPEMVVRLRHQLEKEKGRAYYYVYITDVDSIEHKYGPYTEQHEATLNMISHLLQEELVDKISKKSIADTLVMITADHGQVKMDLKGMVYLDDYNNIMAMFEKSRNGRMIPPTGSPRDVFLHIKPGRLEEARKLFSKMFTSGAMVLTTEQAIRANLFGAGKPSKEFLNRTGNLILFPYEGHGIWYRHSGDFKFEGHHGGLSEQEMLIPFAIARLSDLKN